MTRARFFPLAGLFAALAISAAILLPACASAPIPSPSLAASTPTATAVLPTPTTLPLATPLRSPVPILLTPAPPTASPTSSLPVPGLAVIADHLAQPDDLALGPDGSVYFSSIGDGTVKRLDSTGRTSAVVSGLGIPEGLAFLPDASLAIAEQQGNRILRYDLSTRQVSLLLQLKNNPGHAGVDGIAFDARTATLIVPDSANGTLLRVSPDGKSIQVLARDLTRPTSAAVAPDGSILVADEFGNALVQVPGKGGTLKLVVRLPEPDDVILDRQGNAYVSTLRDGAIHRVDMRTGLEETLWKGFKSPQGLIFDSSGSLLVAEAGQGRVVKLPPP